MTACGIHFGTLVSSETYIFTSRYVQMVKIENIPENDEFNDDSKQDN